MDAIIGSDVGAVIGAVVVLVMLVGLCAKKKAHQEVNEQFLASTTADFGMLFTTSPPSLHSFDDRVSNVERNRTVSMGGYEVVVWWCFMLIGGEILCPQRKHFCTESSVCTSSVPCCPYPVPATSSACSSC
jgi:hypothetical protein